MRTGTRLCLLFSLALAAAVALCGACGHLNDQYEWEEYEPPEPGELDYPKNPAVSLAAIRLHNIELDFQTMMDTSRVDFEIHDDLGREFTPYAMRWSRGGFQLNVIGNFEYCRTYYIVMQAGAVDVYGNTIEDAAIIEAPIGENPNDMLKSGTCVADMALSQVLPEGLDAVILPGEVAADAGTMKELDTDWLDANSVWYVDESGLFDAAGRLEIVPDISGIGTTGAARLYRRDDTNAQGDVVSSHYELHVWDRYDAADESPTSTFLYDVGANAGEELLGPYCAGDIDGDGAAEILLSGQVSYSNTTLQYIYLFSGPLPEEEALALKDSAAVSKVLGENGRIASPFRPVGDIDGDGYDDLAATIYTVGVGGKPMDWNVVIARGNPDLSTAVNSYDYEYMKGTSGRDILGIEGADLTGDGKNELIIVDARRQYVYGKLRYDKARFTIVTGGEESLDGKYVEGAGVHYLVYAPFLNFSDSITVRALGDINGDGYEDLGVNITYRSSGGAHGASKLYVVLGREKFSYDEKIGYSSDCPSALVMNTGSDDRIILRDGVWDARIGDVDNDGHDDFVFKIEAIDADRYEYYLFMGNRNIEEGGQRLIELGDAPASWSFVAR